MKLKAIITLVLLFSSSTLAAENMNPPKFPSVNLDSCLVKVNLDEVSLSTEKISYDFLWESEYEETRTILEDIKLSSIPMPISNSINIKNFKVSTAQHQKICLAISTGTVHLIMRGVAQKKK